MPCKTLFWQQCKKIIKAVIESGEFIFMPTRSKLINHLKSICFIRSISLLSLCTFSLIAVVSRLVWALAWYTNVISLLLRELRKLNP